MKKTIVLLLSILSLGITVNTTRADGVALGGTFGTLGLGGQATLQLRTGFNLRGALNWARFNLDIDSDNTAYDLDLDFRSVLALIDWHPFDTGLRFSGGIVLNNSSITVDATFSDWQEIGGVRYPPELIGRITGDVSMEQFVPYLGIGYGNAVGPATNWSFIFDLGVLFQTFEVELRATGPAAAYPPFQRDLKQEEQDLQDELDKVKIYPVLTIGIAYHF